MWYESIRTLHPPRSLSQCQFPRILGIEACGLVEEAPGGGFKKGEIVATAMGGLGRVIDGGYAEFTCVPASHVVAIQTQLDWSVLGAVPEMLQTAFESLFTSLKLQKGDRLLVRGGTTSVGLAAAAIAKNHGATVAGTTRKTEREELLKGSGCDHFIIDNGTVPRKSARSGLMAQTKYSSSWALPASWTPLPALRVVEPAV